MRLRRRSSRGHLDFCSNKISRPAWQRALRHELRNRDSLYADFADASLTYSSNNMANYKLPYPKEIQQTAKGLKTQYLEYIRR